MFWTEEIAAKVSGPQIVNDSKTPSGRVHVGALRGVLIHDAIYRTLREKGIEARYLFGVDDFDPVDEIPKGEDEHFGQYIGWPLCNTPAPLGGEGDMAEYYMREFWQVFEELGVKVERYRMRDIYRSGQFNEPIDRILRNADAVRRVYKEVSGSERPAHWYPFQVICEKCGCIGTTEVSDYDGKEVTYACLVNRCVNTKLNLGRGCGYEGKTSPFDGRGKLPWKLEWVAKWVAFPVTIEGAGKDHSTKGGSRDVSEGCLRAIYPDVRPPLRVPYEFFLVGGAKMSSSKGVGASARDMADLLPPEVLRFLMIRTKPNSPVNFDVKEEGIVKLFNEFDRYHVRATREKNATPDEQCVYRLADLSGDGDYYVANFQVVTALVQMPHLDPVKEIEKRKIAHLTMEQLAKLKTELGGEVLTVAERRHLEARIACARKWVNDYASEEEKTKLQETLPLRAVELSAAQRAFLHLLADALEARIETNLQGAWDDDALQATVFEVARLTPIEQPLAFKAIYRVLLDKESGPKAGNLIAFLAPYFVIERLRELPYDKHRFWRETATTIPELEKWIEKEREKIAEQSEQLIVEGALTANEFTFVLTDGKRLRKRVIVEGGLLA